MLLVPVFWCGSATLQSQLAPKTEVLSILACEVGDVDVSMMYDLSSGSSGKKTFSISDVRIRRLRGPNRIELCITWKVAASTKLCCIVGLE